MGKVMVRQDDSDYKSTSQISKIHQVTTNLLYCFQSNNYYFVYNWMQNILRKWLIIGLHL